MAVSDEDLEHAIRQLKADIAATLRLDPDQLLSEVASQVFPLADSVQRMVDHVQQHVHDERIATTWPVCPRHPNHPLDFRDGWWWCPRDTVALAPLGRLGPRFRE